MNHAISNPRVVTYWTGSEPPWLKLCLKTFRRNVPGGEVWSHEQWEEQYDGSLGPWEYIKQQRPNVQSDAFRAWFLNKFGGVWVDADCIVFRDLRGVLELRSANDQVAAYRVQGCRLLCTALLGSLSSSFLFRYTQRIKSLLATGRKLRFYDIGPRLFTNIGRVNYFVPALIPQSCIHPLVYWNRRSGLLPKSVLSPPDAFGFMLGHAIVKDHLARKTESEILGSDDIISRSFHRALGDSKGLPPPGRRQVGGGAPDH